MSDTDYYIWRVILTVILCLQDKRLIPGAGATDIELAKRLASYGEVCRFKDIN